LEIAFKMSGVDNAPDEEWTHQSGDVYKDEV
jgi:hypothetical protein